MSGSRFYCSGIGTKQASILNLEDAKGDLASLSSKSLQQLKKERINNTKTQKQLLKKLIPFEDWQRKKVSKEVIKQFISKFNENTVGIAQVIKGNFFILENTSKGIKII